MRIDIKALKHTIKTVGEFSLGDTLHILALPGLQARILEFPNEKMCMTELNGGLLQPFRIDDIRKAILRGRIKHLKKTEGGTK